MNRIIKWLSICMLVAIVACSKEKDTTTYAIPEEARKYLIIPVGRSYIYRDSATGRFDTVVVETSNIERRNSGPGTGNGWLDGMSGSGSDRASYAWDTYHLLMQQRKNNSVWLRTNSTYYDPGSTASSSPAVTISGEATYNNEPKTWSGDIFCFPPSQSVSTYSGSAYINNLQVEGEIYKDVLVVNYGPNVFYWAKGVGVIKRTLLNLEYATSTLVKWGNF